MKADVVVLGGGPAGSSCAVWLSRLGFSAIVVDAREVVGGLLNDSPYRNDWIVTQPGLTGTDLAEGIGLSLAAAGVPMLLGAKASAVMRHDAGFTLKLDRTAGSVDVAADYLVIATGVSPRTGGFAAGPRVLIGPGAHIASQNFRGRSVAVLGGGDNAFENYEFAKHQGAAVTHIYARSIRAGRRFAARAAESDVYLGPYSADPSEGVVNGRTYDLVLVMYGWEPVAAFAEELGLERTERGYLLTDFATCETNVPGVFAIGEVAGRFHPCVITAMADGVVAAKALQKLLESGRSN